MSDEESDTGAYHCPDCKNEYSGYHKCPEGPDWVEFECVDCGENVNRVTNKLDVENVIPVRCTTCTLDRMAEP